MSFDTSASYYEGVRIEERPDGTHFFLDSAPKPAKVRDDAPMVSSIREATPSDPKSGAQPSGAAFVCDFKRSKDGKWVGQDRAGRRYRLRVSHDGATYRVQPEDERPWSVKMGDKALASPGHAHSPEQEAAGLSRWQELLNRHWRRKEPGEAA